MGGKKDRFDKLVWTLSTVKPLIYDWANFGVFGLDAAHTGRSSPGWLVHEMWRRAPYLFISLPAWHFPGPVCFNPRECCRRNWFLFALIKIIFCSAGSSGQGVTSMTPSFFFLPPAPPTLSRGRNSTNCSFICFPSRQGHICCRRTHVLDWSALCGTADIANIQSGSNNILKHERGQEAGHSEHHVM